MFHASDNSNRPLMPTIKIAVWMLFGGLLGALVGSFASNEMFTVASYALGFVGGALVGSIGHRRKLVR